MSDALKPDPKEVIERIGGNAMTAKLCRVTPAAVSQWLRNGIPPARLMFIELARPDIFGSAINRRRKPSVPPS